MDLSFTIQTWMLPAIFQTLVVIYFCRTFLEVGTDSSLDDWRASCGIWLFIVGPSIATHYLG